MIITINHITEILPSIPFQRPVENDENDPSAGSVADVVQELGQLQQAIDRARTAAHGRERAQQVPLGRAPETAAVNVEEVPGQPGVIRHREEVEEDEPNRPLQPVPAAIQDPAPVPAAMQDPAAVQDVN